MEARTSTLRFTLRKGRLTVDEIPLEQLIGSGIVVDVTRQCENNPDYQVTTNDFLAWEKKQWENSQTELFFCCAPASEDSTQTARSTWERRNVAPEAVAKLHFPGLHPDAARWLTANRSIKAIGLDTASIDYGQSTLFESHRILFDKNIPAFENVANLDRLPPNGFSVIALPMKIKGGSGGPLRIVAILN